MNHKWLVITLGTLLGLSGVFATNTHAQTTNNSNANNNIVRETTKQQIPKIQLYSNRLNHTNNINKSATNNQEQNSGMRLGARRYRHHYTRRHVNSNPVVQNNTQSNQNNQQKNNSNQYRQINNLKHVNYWTRIYYPVKVRRHGYTNGYGLYKYGPYGTNSRTFTPMTHEKQLRHDVVHVYKEATVKNRLWVYLIDHTSNITGWMNYDGLDHSTRWFWVPLISQRPQLPTGCEVTATTMMLQHVVGNRVNKMKLARQMPRSWNPNYGFVGSPYSVYGWYIYPNGLRGIVNRYTHHHAWNMTGCSINAIKRQIDAGRPVVIWMADVDGFVNHALTVYGYDSHYLYLNDPWLDRRIADNIPFVQYHRYLDNYRTLSYY